MSNNNEEQRVAFFTALDAVVRAAERELDKIAISSLLLAMAARLADEHGTTRKVWDMLSDVAWRSVHAIGGRVKR